MIPFTNYNYINQTGAAPNGVVNQELNMSMKMEIILLHQILLNHIGVIIIQLPKDHLQIILL